MQAITYSAPSTVQEAAQVLLDIEGAMPLAGGTDVVVGMQTERITPRHLVDLGRIRGLAEITDLGPGVEIGALCTMTQVCRSELVASKLPALAYAAGQMGCWQVRNLGTVGGNLCNAAPSADTAAPLLLYEATALIEGVSGRREVPLAEFFTGPGSTALRKGEILVGVRVPYPPADFRATYVRRALRKSMDIPIVNLAAGLSVHDGTVRTVRDARMVLGAVAPTPIRARKAEAILMDGPLDHDRIAVAAAEAAREARPITDIRATEEYRTAMVEVLCRRALESLVNGGNVR